MIEMLVQTLPACTAVALGLLSILLRRDLTAERNSHQETLGQLSELEQAHQTRTADFVENHELQEERFKKSTQLTHRALETAQQANKENEQLKAELAKLKTIMSRKKRSR